MDNFGNILNFGAAVSIFQKANGSADFVTLEENERRHILEALGRTDWRVSGEKGAAKILEINPHTLLSRMKKLGIERSAR